MSTLTNLPSLPILIPKEASNHRDPNITPTLTRSDATPSLHSSSSNQQDQVATRPCLSTHAVACGSYVCGIASVSEEAHDTTTMTTTTTTTDEWTSWNTSLAPANVCHVISNSDGSIVVAATDAGSVSILRGTDGGVLATRRVVASVEGEGAIPQVSFVVSRSSRTTTCKNDADDNDDMLIVLVPPPSDTTNDGKPSSSTTQKMVVVSSIHGRRLNDDNPQVVAQAARSLTVQTVSLPLSTEPIILLQGVWISSVVVCFAALYADGTLAFFDFHPGDKRMERLEVPTSTTSMVGSVDSEWIIDTEAGLRLQRSPNLEDQIYVMICAYDSNDLTKLFWLDMNHMTLAGEHVLQADVIASANVREADRTQSRRLQVLDFQPLAVGGLSSTLAVAVAFQLTLNGTVEIQVLQLVCEETMGLEVLSRAQVMFTILEPSSVSALALTTDSEMSSCCSFRYVVCGKGGGACAYKAFSTDKESCAYFANLGRLIQSDQLQEVYQLLTQGIAPDPYSVHQPSQVALFLLRKALITTIPGQSSEVLIRECLEYIEMEASTSNRRGIQALLDAAISIAAWPTNDAKEFSPPSATELSMALTAVMEAMERVTKKCSSPHVARQIEEVQQGLMAQLSAVKFIQAELSKSRDGENVLVTRQLAARSAEELFSCLLITQKFDAALKLWKVSQHKLTIEVLVQSIINLTADVDPRGYVTLMRDIIFPNLTINHELLPPLRAWACRIADDLDEPPATGYDFNDQPHRNLDSVIFLLEAVESELRQLQVRIHSSFASYSPFVDHTLPSKRQRHTRNSGEWHQTSVASTKSVTESVLSSTSRPNPTLLEFGRLTAGAMKVPSPTNAVVAGNQLRKQRFHDNYEEIEDIVLQKLHQAKVLKNARSLGLAANVLSLRTYSAKGGAKLLAKELVRQSSRKAGNHRQESIDQVQTFCKDVGVDFDAAVMDYCVELCSSKETSKSSLEESALLACYCESVTARCRVTLVILRASLLVGHSSLLLKTLASDAIGWAAGNATLQSELEEAARLLLVDDIVRRYCGNAAADLFRVDNPRHAIKLLDFVCRHVQHPSALTDAMNLCDAFAHLSKLDACSQLMQYAIQSNNVTIWVTLPEELLQKDPCLALGVCERAIHYCAEVIEEAARSTGDCNDRFRVRTQKRNALVATKAANDVLSLAIEHIWNNPSEIDGLLGGKMFAAYNLEAVKRDFGRLEELQRNYTISLSLHDLNCPKKTLQQAMKVVESLFDGYGDKNLSSELVSARRACSLLAGSFKGQSVAYFCLAVGALACKLAMHSDDEKCVWLLRDLGVFEEKETTASAHVALALAVSLCRKASFQVSEDTCIDGMKQSIRASTLLQRSVLQRCPSTSLSTAVSLAALFDITIALYKGTDQGVGDHLDEFRWKLMSDHKIDSKLSAPNSIDSLDTRMFNMGVVRPTLNSHWNLSDGLLLPPFETHSCCIAFGKEILSYISFGAGTNWTRRNETKALHSFLRERGASAVALRVLSASASMRISCVAGSSLNQLDLVYTTETEETIQRVAERSLGGSGTGMTSGLVDSQFAVALLLSLPLKLSFKVYKSSLPTALLKKDFMRVVTLTNIGKATATDEIKFHDSQIAIGWRNQLKFKAQCERLASKAAWWALLQRYNVDFDLRRFDNENGGRDETNKSISNAVPARSLTGESSYVASILPALVSTLSNAIDDIYLIHTLVVRFVTAFGLSADFAAQKIIEFLLSPLPDKDEVGGTNAERLSYLGGSLVEVKRDARSSIRRCEEAATAVLFLLKSPVQRAAVLRRCFTSFEASLKCGHDYDRLSLVLSLYQNELGQAFRSCQNSNTVNLYKQELEIIHRRRDALTILSSFFRDKRKQLRPCFYGFFPALPVPFDRELDGRSQQHVDVLGADESGKFDPLKPLEGFFTNHSDTASASGLAPLCFPLGIPAGYIHARALMWRFRNSCNSDVPAPTFEGDVLPVLNKIRSASDQTRLAEWCSHFFIKQDLDMLACLESALESAIMASKEAEASRQSSPTDKNCVALERQALETVKRICLRKNALSDKVEIKKILRSGCPDLKDKYSVVSSILDQLVFQLDEIWYENESSPETLVDFLLEKGSLLAANACLSDIATLTMGDLRAMSCLVKRACDAVAEQHSHVHTCRISRILAERWLVHGDQSPNDVSPTTRPVPIDESTTLRNDSLSSTHGEDDDTVNFVMDLANLRDDQAIWGSQSISVQPKLKFTSDEEPVILDDNGSSREESELLSRRAAIRIAFVLAFAEDDPSVGGDEKLHNAMKPTRSKEVRFGLLPLAGTHFEARRCKTFCKELLSIVFAQEDRQHGITDISNLSDSRSDATSSKRDFQKTITFAMKHRALRVASILCPQDALEQCMREEEFVGEAHCSLRKCTFGAFVAKEVEEIKLSLPHSDLVHLSEMHHPTYARTLWRHHRCGGSEGNKGRLLLLLVEMSVRDERSVDTGFLATILNELVRSKLPRSTILTCECLLHEMGKLGTYESNPDVWNALMEAMEFASGTIFAELHRVSTANEKKYFESGARTARRLCKLFRKLNEKHPDGQRALRQFVVNMAGVVNASHDATFSANAATIAIDAIGKVDDKDQREKFGAEILCGCSVRDPDQLASHK